jgi:hypothetical protein
MNPPPTTRWNKKAVERKETDLRETKQQTVRIALKVVSVNMFVKAFFQEFSEMTSIVRLPALCGSARQS